MKKFVWLALGFIVLVSCVATEGVGLGTAPPRPPVPWGQVAVYLSADQVPRKCEEVALRTSTADATLTGEKAVWDSMKKKAGKMGANAIILDATSEPKAGTKVVTAIFGVSAERKGKAIAIFVFPKEKK